MCHFIFWYHALCLHLDPSASSMIFCSEAIVCGEECLPATQEQFYIPLTGLCGVCQDTIRRYRRAKRRREPVCEIVADADADEDWSWMYTTVLARPQIQKTKRRRHEHHHHQHYHHHDDMRIFGSSEDGDATIYQEQQHQRKSGRASNTERWDHASETLTPDPLTSSRSTSNNDSQPEPWTPRCKTEISRKDQRSCIPVAKHHARREAKTTMALHLEVANSDDDDGQYGRQSWTSPSLHRSSHRYQQSWLPVRKNRFQREELDTKVTETTPQLSADESEVESGVDEMELFDRVTF